MNNRSFTLIELLVVIAIVGILSGIVLMSSSGAVNSAQNARIKNDIDSLRKVILSYKAYYRLAPIEDPACNIGSDCSQLASDLLAIDPNISFPTNPSGGYYRYYSANGTTFTITADLPNSRTLVYDFQNGYSEYASLAGYTKRKSITISSSASLTDYQVKVDVTYDSDMLSSFDDLRFTLSNGTTELNYWTESVSAGVSAVVWVKVPSLAIGDNTIYMYYGNASASTASNGDNTFELFDHFEGSSLDANKWTAYDSSNGISISNSILTISGASSIQRGIYSILTFGINTVNRYYSKYNTYQASGYCNVSGNRYTQIVKGTSGLEKTVSYISNETNTSITIPETVYATYEIKRNNTSSIIYIINNSIVSTHVTQIPTESINIQYYIYNSSTDTYIDWVLVRQYTATEPSISSWGTEESI